MNLIKTFKKHSPVYLFIFILLSIFLVDIFIAFVLSDWGFKGHALMDAIALDLLLVPAIYFFLYRPLKLQLIEAEKIEKALAEHRDNLRQLVESKTSELRSTNLLLHHEIINRKFLEEEAIRNYEIQKVINQILQISLSDITLEEFLNKTLEIIFSISWKNYDSKGAIFIVKDNILHLKAHYGINQKTLEMCKEVPIGKCICGKAAETKKIQFVNQVNHLHEIHYCDITPHGHYAIPMVIREQIIGVINIYLKEYHFYDTVEEEFFVSIANTVALIIQKYQIEEERQKIQEQLIQIQKMESIGKLAGGIAHDFNNLLTPIKGYAELGLQKTKDNKVLNKFFEQIFNASNKAANLISQLLIFSRKHPMKLTVFNLNKTIENFTNMVSNILPYNIDITLELDPNLLNIKADESNIDQVIMNLIVNAVDAMPNGGNIKIKTENIEIKLNEKDKLSELEQGKYVLLSVIDNGIGMSKEVISHIFEPFYTTKDKKGTGLGLSVVYGIIKKHNGSIVVHSEEGLGTIFKIYLPAYTEIKDNLKTIQQDNISLEGNKEKILLVEDENNIRELTKLILEENNYIVYPADSYKSAIEIFQKYNKEISLVITDYVLDESTGENLINEFFKIKPDIPVIITSGYIDNLDKNIGFKFIQKPYTSKELLETVKISLNR